jgi:hypothetical protein
MHPGFQQAHGSIEAAVAAKLKHYSAYEQPIEVQRREFFGHLLEAARQPNQPALRQLLAAMPPGVDFDDCAEAAMERHDPQAATQVLLVQYDHEREDEPRDAWLHEKLRELAETIRSR